MLAVDCGSVEASAWRALMAATCAGVACFGAVGASPQKPRALMISAGVCGFASAFSANVAAACLAFAGCTACTSAEASWKVAAAAGFARGIGTGSADLAGAAAVPATGEGFSLAAGGLAPSAAPSFDFALDKAADMVPLPPFGDAG